ncbi:S8 family serine peptidase [Micromonospora sp. NPDC003197]
MQSGPTQPHGHPQPWPPPWPATPPSTGSGAGAVVAAVLVGCWAVFLTVTTQAIGWLIAQLLLASGIDEPAWLWPLVGVVNAALVALPAGLLAALPRSPAVRTTGRVWLVSSIGLGVFGLLRTIPMPHHEGYLAALTAVLALATVLLRWLARRAKQAANPSPTVVEPPVDSPSVEFTAKSSALGFGIAAGLALLLPWAWVGALGGLLETVLAMAVAAAAGWFAATLLDGRFWTAYQRPTDRRPASGPRPVLLGGLVAGVALVLLAAGIGQPATQLALLFILPPAGFALAALRPLAQRAASSGTPPGASAATGWLIGLATLGPLAFVDPEEVSLLLMTSRDVPFWALVAAGSSLAVALLLGLGYALSFARPRAGLPRRWLGAATAVVVLLAGTGVYVGLGQPGLYGERLFVVLKEQADLTTVNGQPGQAGRDARAREVYQRLVATAERSQAGLRRDLDRLGLDYTPYYLVNAIEVDGGPAVRAWLSRHDAVSRVLLSQRLRPLPAPIGVTHGEAAAPTSVPWNLSLIGADRVWSQLGVTGTGIVVGGSDSGVDGQHPTLAPGFRGGDDSWYDPWNATRSPDDQNGHGTHTLATAVGGNNVGVAPGARWVGCVNLDRNLGNPARYLDCLQFMLAPFPTGGNPFTDGRPERAPQILTNSWGCPTIEGCDPGALRPATAALAAAGIFVTAAAGNTGPYCGSVDDPPATYSDVFTVGAVDRKRTVTDFSSRGPAPGGTVKPDLVAPGADILSAMPGGGYAAMDGTSMATPHVAGVVALMWSANPALIGDLDRTWEILLSTTTSVSPGADPANCGATANVEGAGMVDAYAAVRAARM